jgi:hypothetical protein
MSLAVAGVFSLAAPLERFKRIAFATVFKEP